MRRRKRSRVGGTVAVAPIDGGSEVEWMLLAPLAGCYLAIAGGVGAAVALRDRTRPRHRADPAVRSAPPSRLGA